MLELISNMRNREEGQALVEYALILVLVSIVVIVILITMGNQIANVFSNVVAALACDPRLDPFPQCLLPTHIRDTLLHGAKI